VAGKFYDLTFTPAVIDAQEHYFGRGLRVPPQTGNDPLTDEEMEFIRSRDSFYMATVSETGWPYVQHRGGDPGFLHVLSPTQLAFADYRGNRQLLSTGNLAVNNRVSLFLMDYARRERLKILGTARVEDARQNASLVEQVSEPQARSIVERVFLIKVVSYDWNCSKYITPRFTEEQVRKAMAPLEARIAELEAELKKRLAK
jgi:predicted pyridoxine 5'-phosphate oxidase superfamily flavin-nucleotide-binding protein